MTTRKIDALRNLAERPGTPAEGEVARRMLERLEGKGEAFEWTVDSAWFYMERYLRTHDRADLDKAERAPSWCDCGAQFPRDTKCANDAEHFRIRFRITQIFPKVTRVYYNCHAYSPNCPGVVVGYSSPWNWIRIKFDHLKTVRSVPVYRRGWMLSKEPK